MFFMKQLNETFEDEEHKKITKLKKKLGLNWHDFILSLVDFYVKNRNMKGGENGKDNS